MSFDSSKPFKVIPEFDPEKPFEIIGFNPDKNFQVLSDPDEIKSIVKLEVSKIRPQIIERIVEKQVIQFPVKSEKKEQEKLTIRIDELAHKIEKNSKEPKDKSVEILQADIKELRESFENLRQMLPMLGGSGVIGIPPPEPNPEGYVLTVQGGKAKWKEAGSTSSTISIGDANTDGSWQIIISGTELSFQRRESGSWVEKGSMVP